MSLKEYYDKRDFNKTPEPKGKKTSSKSKAIFVIQKHEASHLHYDFRLEINNVLKSWAIPKNISTNPKIKRLAIETEDHPLEYAGFEGVIPEGEYGEGKVSIFDKGDYQNLDGDLNRIAKDYQNGLLKIWLSGHKIKGGVMLKKFKDNNQKQWLVIKMKDEFANIEV